MKRAAWILTAVFYISMFSLNHYVKNVLIPELLRSGRAITAPTAILISVTHFWHIFWLPLIPVMFCFFLLSVFVVELVKDRVA